MVLVVGGFGAAVLPMVRIFKQYVVLQEDINYTVEPDSSSTIHEESRYQGETGERTN